MAQEALVAIKDIGYSGAITNIQLLHQALDGGPKSIPYTQLVHFITNELRPLCEIDEQVNAINSGNDSSTFLMEISSFLKELGCPYESLTQGHLSDRLSTKQDKLLLVTYLISELMAVRMSPSKKPAKTMELKLQESPHAFHMRHLLQAFRFSKPPADVTIQSLFQKLTPTVDRVVKSVPAQLLSAPALNATLTAKQWEALSKVQMDLHAEYSIRREMLLKRLDCTIQSFQWSDSTRGKETVIDRVYSAKREQLSTTPDVSIADLLCAREDLAILEKTSNASVRKNTKSAVNKVIIGQVPDRGGRSWEQAPPPPEMPSWQQRNATPQGFSGQRGGGRGGGRGGHRGSHDDGRGAQRQSSGGFDSAGSFGNYSTNYQQQPQQRGSFDSAGSYGGSFPSGHQTQYTDKTKRHKSSDSFQTDKNMTHAEQYVQESNQNRQYQGDRGSGRGGRGYRSGVHDRRYNSGGSGGSNSSRNNY